MAILIKDMEMPKSCSDCPLNYDEMACMITGTRWWSDKHVLLGFDSCKDRLWDCPLKEVPEPERQKGKWIYEPGHIPKCSVYGIYSDDADRGYDNFCPDCGSDMRGDQDD